MKYYRLFMCMFALAMLAALGYAQDDYLNPSDSGANAAAKQDIKQTMGGENLFNTNPHAGAVGSSNKATVMISKNTKLPESTLASANVAGAMSLLLTDSTTRSVNLVVTQSGDVVFGKGSMTSNGMTQDVAATGSISSGKLNLDLLSMNDINLFKLSIDISGKSLSGSYSAISSSAAPWVGTAAGSLA